LGGVANPASLAALSVLESLTTDAKSSDKPLRVTTGDGSLYVAGVDISRKAMSKGGAAGGDAEAEPQFIASDADPMAYAAGVSDIVRRENLGSNLIIGRIGAELAIIAEAAERGELEQIIGSDDLSALAVSIPITDDIILGEELYAAAAYLHGEPAHIASLQLQDILRILAAISVLVAALISLVIG
jgi:hypothetical protein